MVYMMPFRWEVLLFKLPHVRIMDVFLMRKGVERGKGIVGAVLQIISLRFLRLILIVSGELGFNVLIWPGVLKIVVKPFL